MVHSAVVDFVSFTADSRLVVTGSGGDARIWNAPSGKLQTDAMRAGGPIELLRLSPDGKRLVGLSLDDTVRG